LVLWPWKIDNYRVGSAVVGVIGAGAEMAFKGDKVTVGEIFVKTLQAGTAATILTLGAMFSLNTAGFVVAGGIGVAMLLTPIVNAIIQGYGSDALKQEAEKVDSAVSIASKVIWIVT
jgi:hypothetical protein